MKNWGTCKMVEGWIKKSSFYQMSQSEKVSIPAFLGAWNSRNLVSMKKLSGAYMPTSNLSTHLSPYKRGTRYD